MQIMIRLTMLLVVAVGCIGCSSGGPTMSGFAIGETRIVHVGETVELRIPINEHGDREWRVTSYDSLHLVLASQPRYEQADDGSIQLLVAARARAPGETVVELQQVPLPGQTPKRARFKVRILD